MELTNLKDLNLSTEESRDIIKFIAQKRGITTNQLLSTIKRKNNEILATKPQQKVAKTLQKVAKTLQKVVKTLQKVGKFKIIYEKLLNLAKRETLTTQKPLKTTKPQILSKTKRRIEIIREKLKELHHKLSKVN